VRSEFAFPRPVEDCVPECAGVFCFEPLSFGGLVEKGDLEGFTGSRCDILLRSRCNSLRFLD
jgi:hypothetical protein